MLEIRPGCLADLLAIDYTAPLATSDNRLEFARDPVFAEAILQSHSWILHEDGKPIAAMGLIPKWHEVAFGWSILPDHQAQRHPLSLTRMAHKGFEYAKAVLGIKRIEIAVLLSHRKALHWAYSLGFQHEGRASCYGPGALGTVVLFARVV